MTPIRAEILAGKLEAAHNGDAPAFAEQLVKEPRLLELLWFLEAIFRQPGGEARFLQRLIEFSPDRFQTQMMIGVGPPKRGDKYSLEQCLPVWKTAAGRPSGVTSFGLRADESEDELYKQRLALSNVETLRFEDWLALFVGPETTVEDARAGGHQAEALRIGLQRFNYPFLKKHCEAAARSKLPRLFIDWCEEKSIVCRGTWFCPQLLETLFDFMDRHAKEAAAKLAETEVAKIVFRELEFARSQKVPIAIIGASRFGKTKTIMVWTEMRPGLARLVTMPDSNRERDFFEAHADAFGISYTPSTTTAQLKRSVEYVHRHSGLFVVYDEFHFAIPINYHKATPPRRLNWIRCQVIDRELGCAFFATPQSYRETLAAYAKKTGYCLEQFVGRMGPAVVLPESLAAVDMIAVARKHFPDVLEPYLKLISARAMQSEGYLKSMELAVKRARFLMAERGRLTMNSEDVKDAIDQMMPSGPRPSRRIETASQSESNPAAAGLPPNPRRRRRGLFPEPALLNRDQIPFSTPQRAAASGSQPLVCRGSAGLMQG